MGNDNDTKFAKAHQFIGEYFSAFSSLERELGEAVKAVLDLDGHDAADIVVAALRYPSTKARLVKDAVAVAKNADGTETSKEWKEKAKETLGEILTHNDETRVPLAHSHLEPREDGSIKLTSPKRPTDQKTWYLQGKIEDVRRLTKELRAITDNLTTLTISIPELPSYWLTADPYQHRAYMGLGFDQTKTPLAAREEAAKKRADR